MVTDQPIKSFLNSFLFTDYSYNEGKSIEKVESTTRTCMWNTIPKLSCSNFAIKTVFIN